MRRERIRTSLESGFSATTVPECGGSLGYNGFTLVELLVVTAIVSIVMGAIYSVFIHSNRVYISQEELAAAQQEVRSALDILGREIRMAGFIAANNKIGGLEPITAPAWAGSADSAIEIAEVDDTAKTTTLAFKSDLDAGDSDLDGDDDTEALRYVYYHGDHPDPSRRNTSEEGEKLFLENIEDVTFTYQIADGTSTTTPTNLDDIRGVVISITARTSIAVEPYEGGKGIRTRQLISNIQIRNLGLS
jgi:type IV pilus assembly protein PilW